VPKARQKISPGWSGVRNPGLAVGTNPFLSAEGPRVAERSRRGSASVLNSEIVFSEKSGKVFNLQMNASRSTFSRLCWTTLLLFGCAGSLCRSQVSADHCSEVQLYASVLSAKGRIVAGLRRENFTAQINGQPARITGVDYTPQAHRAVILIDHSGSMSGMRWSVIRQGSFDVLQLIPEGIPVSVYFFDDKPRQLVSPTADRKLVTSSLQQFLFSAAEGVRGRTALFDAIDAALSSLSPAQPGDLILVVTDGGDNNSRMDAGKLQKKLLNSETRLFALLLGSESVGTPAERYGTPETEQMVERSGGVVARLPVEDDDGRHSQPPKLTQEEENTISQVSTWLVQNMIDSYRLTLMPGQFSSDRGKLKLQVTVPQSEGKFRIAAPATVAVKCP